MFILNLTRRSVFILSNKKNSYAPEFREYVTKMVVLDGHKMTDVCKKLEIPYGTLTRWLVSYKNKQHEAVKERQNQVLTATEYKEVYEKERQNKLELEEENEILKKAMHIFTQGKN